MPGAPGTHRRPHLFLASAWIGVVHMDLPEKSLAREVVKPAKGPSRLPWLIALVVLALAVVPLYFMWKAGAVGDQAAKPPSAAAPQGQAGQPGAPAPPAPSKHGEVIELNKPEDTAPGGEQDQRKKQFGLDKSVDAVLRSDETVKVGDQSVPVSELERKLAVQSRGELLERPIDGSSQVSAWGVHLVNPNDNLWNIHFVLLREYLATRGLKLAADADEPTSDGYSSGVGRTLKFAEHMVGVYNLKTGRMSSDLSILEPGQKLVVFNLSELFGALAKVNPQELAQVRFDGRTLFFPADEAAAQQAESQALQQIPDQKR